jgi:hypothetical protein
MTDTDREPTSPAEEPQDQFQILVAEANLVSGLVTDTLSIIQQTDAVSLLGLFTGVWGVAGGIAKTSLDVADPEHHVALAKYFADSMERSVALFRRVEAGENINDVWVTPVTPEVGNV